MSSSEKKLIYSQSVLIDNNLKPLGYKFSLISVTSF